MKGKKVAKTQQKSEGSFEKLVKQKLESKKKREAKKADLLKRMELQIRRSKFTDKRLGEHNPNISTDQKMLMRFTRERSKVRKGKKFNLDDDEGDEFAGLTHMGKNIDDIDDFKEPIGHSDYSDSEEDNSNYMIDYRNE